MLHKWNLCVSQVFINFLEIQEAIYYFMFFLKGRVSSSNQSCEIQWLHYLLNDLHVSSQSTIVYCDNHFASYLSYNHVFHQHIKHIKINYHLIREKIQQGLIYLLLPISLSPSLFIICFLILFL